MQPIVFAHESMTLCLLWATFQQRFACSHKGAEHVAPNPPLPGYASTDQRADMRQADVNTHIHHSGAEGQELVVFGGASDPASTCLNSKTK